MQYSFSYMYFMMQEPKPFNLDDFWALIDTDRDQYARMPAGEVAAGMKCELTVVPTGAWCDRPRAAGNGRALSNNEIRTLGTRVLPWPMEAAALVRLREMFINCSRETGETVLVSTPEPASPDELPPFAALAHRLGEDLPPMRVPKQLFEECETVLELVRQATKQQTKHKYADRARPCAPEARPNRSWSPACYFWVAPCVSGGMSRDDGAQVRAHDRGRGRFQDGPQQHHDRAPRARQPAA